MLGIGAVSVAAPKFYFDYGKNSRIYTPKIFPEFEPQIHIIPAPKGGLNLTDPQGLYILPDDFYRSIEITKMGNRLLFAHNPTRGIVGGIYRS